ncbi:hypothetical protein K438DRAFT_845690 [Mycena galopus ATCC 62051]|nr:hypothetical protein K438DRAFT_845690 [Mycena galopus ATCC 62051]
MLSPSLANSPTQSTSGGWGNAPVVNAAISRRRRRQNRINPASPMPDGLPRAIIGVRDSTPLSKCAATCHNAAGAAVCPDLATTCQCTNANFRSDFLSCVQGECQAAELDNAQQFVAGLCGTVSLSAKPTATVPFLPTNPNADINEPSHTSIALSNSSSSARNVSSSSSAGESITATPSHPRSDFSGNWIPKHRLNPDGARKWGASRGYSGVRCDRRPHYRSRHLRVVVDPKTKSADSRTQGPSTIPRISVASSTCSADAESVHNQSCCCDGC